jgi:hypothetical protein
MQLVGRDTRSEVHDLRQPCHAQVVRRRDPSDNFFCRPSFNIKSYPHAWIDSTVDKYRFVEQGMQTPKRIAKWDTLPVNRRRALRCFRWSAGRNPWPGRFGFVARVSIILSPQARAIRGHSNERSNADQQLGWEREQA